MKKIFAGIDFSNVTPKVVETVISLARAYGARAEFLHILEIEPPYTAYGFTPDEFPAIQVFQDEAKKRAAARLDAILAEVPADVAGQVGIRLIEGLPLPGLLKVVEEDPPDLVVVGSHGHGALAALLLGSVAEGLVRKSPVPTLVVPAPRE